MERLKRTNSPIFLEERLHILIRRFFVDMSGYSPDVQLVREGTKGSHERARLDASIIEKGTAHDL